VCVQFAGGQTPCDVATRDEVRAALGMKAS
jgi:hypothetical protein